MQASSLQAEILRLERHRVLLLEHLRGRRVQPDVCDPRLVRLRRGQLCVCGPRRVVWTIDMYTFGRGSVLLVSFPLMALMLLMTGFALYVSPLSLVALLVQCEVHACVEFG